MTPIIPANPLGVETSDEAVLVTIGESHLDAVNAEAVARQLYALVQPSLPGRLVLDFHNVRFLTSTFLAGLLTLRRLLKVASGQLALKNVNRGLYEVLEVTNLTQVFEVHRLGEADIPARPA